MFLFQLLACKDPFGFGGGGDDGTPLGGLIDQFEEFTNPLVAGVVILGVDDPDLPGLDQLLEQTPVDPATGVTLFLGSATEDAIEDAPRTGARAVVDATDGMFELAEVEPGLYAVDPVADPIPYESLATWSVLAADTGNDGTSALHVTLPQAARVNIPARIDAGTAIPLDFTGQGFHSAVVVVVDATTGDLVFSTAPDSLEAVFELATERIALTTWEIPGEAFAEPGAYLVGVAGMRHTSDDQLTNLNTLFSRGMAGKLVVAPVEVRP